MRTITDTERLTEIEYYPNKSWVKHQGARVLKPNGTSTPTDFVWSYVERRDALNYTGNPVWTGKQHLMSPWVSQNKILDSDNAGVDWSVTGVNGAQQPTITIRYLNGGGVSDVRTWQEFAYDNGMRMTDQKYLYALNGAGLSAPTFTLSNQVYNYKDQLIEKNIGYRGTNQALQSIDYQYNTRGWLTGINTVNVYGGQSILTPSGMGSGAISGLAVTPFLGEALSQGMSTEQNMQGKALLMPPVADNNVDLFSQVLTYGNPDGRTQANAQYNGNISSTTWQVAGRAKQAYGFAYDDLNRLTDAKYFDVTDSYSGSWNSNFSQDNKFHEKLTYDLRGNIITLQRNGMNSNGWTGNNFIAGTYGRIDNLTYAYNTKNQLLSVNEASLPTRGFKTNPNATGDQYGYDGNGNLTFDKNKYITSIEYNYLNLPIKVVIDNPTDAVNSGSIEFVYDATGAKLRKTVKYSNGNVKETWDYVNGVEYKNRQLQRVAHSEGAVVQNEHGQYQHEYVLRDHLGNTRVTFTDGVNKGEPYWDWSNYTYIQPDNTGYDDGVVTEADIKHINHTYPFGMAMEGNWNNAGNANNNRYLYNGKQWNDDFGMGWYDYGARFYDPTLGRFFTQDRFAEKYTTQTPYQYAGNNPIKNVDVNGDSILIRHGTGFLGLGKKEVVVYRDGKLTNRDGSAFTGPVKGFLKSTVSALNQINSKPKGEALLSKFEGSKNVLIKQGTNSANDPADGKLAVKEGAQAVINYSGTSTGGPDVNGSTDRPDFIGLAHELGHVESALFDGTIIAGMKRYERFDPTNPDSDLKKVQNDEYNAAHVENEIRTEHGVPLRQSYTRDSEGKSFMIFLQPGTKNNVKTGKSY